MQARDVDCRLKRNMEAVIAMAAILGVVFYSGFPRGTWLHLLALMVLQVYLQGVSVTIDERTVISLGTAAVLPTLYLTGVTPSMLVSVILGISDGVRHRKEWRRTAFNSAQMALSSMAGALTFEYLGGLSEASGLWQIVAATCAILVYITCNIGFVCRIGAIWKGVSWWTQFRTVIMRGIYSSLSSGFIGIIFTFFVKGYGFWGLAAFSILLVNLSGLLNAAAEVSAERALRQELEKELVIDEMTGAYNFRFLNNWLSRPSDEKISLLFLDIDDFAVFNNTYGHAEGDKVLKKLVETISANVREGDHVIRYGGDEFVVFLKEMDAAGAKRVADRIARGLAALDDPKWKQPITVSIGIAAKPEQTTDKRELLLFADQAMYLAKDAGKDTIRMWDGTKDSA